MKQILIILLLLSICLYGKESTPAGMSKTGTISIQDQISKVFNIEGYFRGQMGWNSNFDLDSYYINEEKSVLGTSHARPTLDEINDDYNDEGIVSYNFRLRFAPTIEVGEFFKAVATVDLLDNIVAGSSSDQNIETIALKEGYAKIKSPFGLLTAGRVATQWGMGIFRNSGRDKFANGGTYIDQVNFFAPIPMPNFEHFAVSLGYEFNQSGLNSSDLGDNRGLTSDLDDNDDRTTFTVSLSDRVDGDELGNLLRSGQNRFNWQVYWGYIDQEKRSTAGTDTTNWSYDKNGMGTMMLDAYLAFYVNTAFKVEAEAFWANDDDFTIWGGVVKTTLSMMMETLKFGVNVGVANGDSDIDPYDNIENQTNEDIEKSDIPYGTSFTFNADYQIDLILFREVTPFTNAFYVKPHITYMFSDQMALSFWGVYSQAIETDQTFGKDSLLGIEIDTRLEYVSRSGLTLGVAGGFLIPGDGMDWLGADKKRESTLELNNKDHEANIAWSLQAFVIMKF